ncbi:5' DNA nuclease [Rhizobium oryzicola]|uniref:5' DNA nuclease n=1 Tax=Rhizobium oryzicola TaxID=1232668 RepID=A0ABT8STR0_9HYPH|nr:5' DNA nuclease [Rhizobium oryzicola]MDO1581829.1 5' DNA nuclease [Rhizobium oryzicola]
MAGGPNETGEGRTTAEPTLGFTLPFADSAAVHAAMTNPAAAIAAATAVGMSLSAQMANAFFGMAQAALEVSARLNSSAPATPAKEEVKAAEPATSTEAAKPEPVVVKLEPKVAQAPAVSAVEPEIPVKAPVAKKAPAAKKVAAPVKAKAPKVVTPAPAVEVTPVPVKKAAAKKVSAKAAAKADDLKKISGIGPKLETLLNDLGIRRYHEIAAWTQTEVEHFDRELGLDGRIAKDDWIAQAKALLR